MFKCSLQSRSFKIKSTGVSSIAICFSWNICVDLQILQSFEVVEEANFLRVETLVLRFRSYRGRLILKYYYFYN